MTFEKNGSKSQPFTAPKRFQEALEAYEKEFSPSSDEERRAFVAALEDAELERKIEKDDVAGEIERNEKVLDKFREDKRALEGLEAEAKIKNND